MRDAILRDLQTEYEQQRADDSREEDRRRAMVVAKCPEIGKLLEERQRMIWQGVRGILDGHARADDLPGRMEVITGRITALLKQNGFAADYLDPVYRCAKCRDTGYVGEPIREQCECLRSRLYTRLYRAVGLSETGEQSFETFDETVFPAQKSADQPLSQRACMCLLRDRCAQYADHFPADVTKDLLLTGKSGLGKTFLMHAMAKRLLDRGFNVLLISAYRFLDVARKAYFGRGGDEMDALMDTDVLMLDDLGSEPLMENITIVQLFNLINERQTAGKGTVISTNLNEKELRERYTERVTSRLLDKRQCDKLVFMGDDVRRRA